MANFVVIGVYHASEFLEVEAESPEEASEEAMSRFSASLCHHCSRKLELGDISHHHVLLDGEEVYSDDLTVEQPVECTDGWETIKRAMHALNAVVSNGVTTDVGSPAYVASYLLKRFDSIMEHSDTWNSTEDGTENGE